MSEFLQVAGGIAACASAAAVLLSRDPRVRAAGMVLGLLLAVSLVAGQAWDGQLDSVRHSPAKLALLIAAGAAGIAVLAAIFDRRRELLPLALIAALPFRIPVDAGGESSNLLLPLYAVIAGGAALALCRATRRGAAEEEGALEPPRFATWLARALAAAIVLYAVQAAYSSDVSRAIQNIAFFYVPFAIAFAMLRDARWDRALLAQALVVVIAEGAIFAVIGIGQEITRHIFWNDKAMESNEFDLQFRVNSLFWDPNIYGRYLALTMVVGAAALSWVRDARRFAAGTAALLVIAVGFFFSYSQTSSLSLLAGLVVLCALRWSLKRTILIGAPLAVAGAIVLIAFTGSTDNGDATTGNSFDESSGRSELTSGGIDLWKDRPAQGYGSGSFAVEFARRHTVLEGQAAVSHTEPVTVAAEQGAIGLFVYLTILLGSAWLLLGGRLIAAASSASRPGAAGDGSLPSGGDVVVIARVAIAAAFAGLLVHTLGYAGFLTDPLTWALLGIASGLVAREPS